MDDEKNEEEGVLKDRMTRDELHFGRMHRFLS